jgi:hypothetical protein
MNRLPLLTLILTLLFFQCSSTYSLTDIEKAKLDRHLLQLLSGKQTDETLFDVQEKADGIKLYTVIIRSNQAEEIKHLGVSVSSVFGDVIVARATVPQLRALVASQSVSAIQTGNINLPQPHNQ